MCQKNDAASKTHRPKHSVVSPLRRLVRRLATVALAFAPVMPAGPGQAWAMTCNVARPYNKETTVTIPAFSRLREDLLFQKGDRIEIVAFPRIRPVRCTWASSRNMVNTPFLTGEGTIGLDQSVKMVIPTEKLPPGFYDLNFTVQATDKDQETGKTTFGYRVGELPVLETRPADFETFWRTAAKQAADTPLNASEAFIQEMDDAAIARYNQEQASLPGDYDPEGKRARNVQVYKIQFDAPGGKRLYGWLTKPVGNGPFPGLLVLPGAGCNKLPMPLEHARHGYVALLLHIHGQDVDLVEYSPPKDYLIYLSGGHGQQPAEDYYSGVIQACVQAVKYLAARPDVDPQKLAVVGGSQGGMLAIITAALCPEIKAVVSTLCAYADFPYRDWVNAVNARKSDGMDQAGPTVDARDPRQVYMSYFDVMNFAPMVKGATLMGACLNDTPTPVTTVHAVYRRLGHIPKEMLWSPGTDHDLLIAFEWRAWRWLDRALGLTSK